MNPLQRVIAVVGLSILTVVVVWLVSIVRRPPQPREITEPRSPVILDEARQKDICRAEHTTFEIEHRFGPAFLDALTAWRHSLRRSSGEPGWVMLRSSNGVTPASSNSPGIAATTSPTG